MCCVAAAVLAGLSENRDSLREGQLGEVPLARVGGGDSDGEGREEGGGVLGGEDVFWGKGGEERQRRPSRGVPWLQRDAVYITHTCE